MGLKKSVFRTGTDFKNAHMTLEKNAPKRFFCQTSGRQNHWSLLRTLRAINKLIEVFDACAQRRIGAAVHPGQEHRLLPAGEGADLPPLPLHALEVSRGSSIPRFRASRNSAQRGIYTESVLWIWIHIQFGRLDPHGSVPDP